MTLSRIALSFAFIFTVNSLIAQNNSTQKKKNFHKQLKETTTAQIKQLENGALLVRLKTSQNAISGLRARGMDKQADAVEKKQAWENQNIINAFREYYKFSPVYFFYSYDSHFIKNKSLDSVVFIDDQLHLDPSIKLNQQRFLVADFGVVEQDTATYFDHYSLQSDGNYNVKQVKNYYGGPSFGYEGLIIRSEDLIQLRHPFPYFVRTHGSDLKKKLVNRVVRKMNKKLQKFAVSMKNK
ncbi:MAG TPA: hypothetical protein VFF27_16780 [Bacteroidia bacterium]|jgi:hypothetical protein|nr:hypothetical protein [Bacteroidia bacterium]